MEINNKAFWVICVAVVGVTFYVRAQSTQTPAATEAPKITQTVVQKPKPRRPIPNSAMPPEPPGQTDDQTAQDDTPVTIEAIPDPAPVAAAPATAPAATQPNDNSANADPSIDDLASIDDIGSLMDPTPADITAQQNSDRELLRVMIGGLPREQRDAFRLMWYTMSTGDRQDFIDQLRGNLPQG